MHSGDRGQGVGLDAIEHAVIDIRDDVLYFADATEARELGPRQVLRDASAGETRTRCFCPPNRSATSPAGCLPSTTARCDLTSA